MKLSIIAILLLFGQTIVLQASEVDIDAQIAKIEQASEEDRFRLVNALKRQIAQMNANQQARAIARYQQETLKAQQQADFANEIVINNQMQKEQERQTIVPPVKTTPSPAPVHTPTTEEEKIILNPKPQEYTPVEDIYQPQITKDPLPIEKPEYIPTPQPIEQPIIENPIVEKPIEKPPVQEIQKPQEVFVEQPKKPEPVYVPPTPAPKVEPVEEPTYTAPSKSVPTKTDKPSFSKGRF